MTARAGSESVHDLPENPVFFLQHLHRGSVDHVKAVCQRSRSLHILGVLSGVLLQAFHAILILLIAACFF